MNVDTLAEANLSAERIGAVIGPIDDGESVSLIGVEQLSARPDDFVILFQDEDTARSAASKFGREFVCVFMKTPSDADSIDLEPLRDRSVYVWRSQPQVADDEGTLSLMWILQDQVDAEVYTPAEFLNLLV